MRRPLRRRARDDAGRHRGSRHSSARTASWCPSTGGRVVPLPPPVRRTAAERARAHRAGGGGRAQRSRDGLVHRQRPARGGDRLRPSCGRDGDRRRLGRRPQPCRSTTTAAWRPLEEWLGWFGDDELVQYPALAVFGAWWRALTGRAEEAERWLALADGATSTIPLSDGSATIEPWVATLRAHMMPNGVEQALADADLALDQLSPDSFWIPTALLGRGVAHAPARRDRSCEWTALPQPSSGGWPPAASKRSTWHRRSSRSSRPRKEPGARQGDGHGRQRRSSRRRASATTRRARSRTSRRRASHSTRGGRRRPARRSHAPTAYGPCSTTASPG